MFGVEPLARIVRHDARIEVKVPATKGKKAYSYFREGGKGEKKSSSVGRKAAFVGGGLALAGLGAAAIAMNRKKTETGGVAAPISEPKKVENNTARNVAIGVGAAGLGATAAKIAISKKKEVEDPKGTEKQESEDRAESLEDIAKKPDTAHIQLVVKGRDVQKLKSGQPLMKNEVDDLIGKSSYFKVSDYQGEKGYSQNAKFKSGEAEDDVWETYITVLVPKSPDLLKLAKGDKKPIAYSIKSRIPDSGGLLGGHPRSLRDLEGLESFGRI